jgi:hypothetical protein
VRGHVHGQPNDACGAHIFCDISYDVQRRAGAAENVGVAGIDDGDRCIVAIAQIFDSAERQTADEQHAVPGSAENVHGVGASRNKIEGYRGVHQTRDTPGGHFAHTVTCNDQPARPRITQRRRRSQRLQRTENLSDAVLVQRIIGIGLNHFAWVASAEQGRCVSEQVGGLRRFTSQGEHV